MDINLEFTGITITSFKTSPNDPNKRHLIAEVHFNATTNNKKFENMNMPIIQPFGIGAIGGDIEVGQIQKTNYDISWNHNQFVAKVKEYLGMCVGPKGRLLNTSNSQNINLIMKNCRMGLIYKTKIQSET